VPTDTKSDGERFFVESFDDYVTDVATFVTLIKSRERGRLSRR
jgi:hypothetical protein